MAWTTRLGVSLLLLCLTSLPSWGQVVPGGGGGGGGLSPAACALQVMTGITAGGGINCTTITQAYVDNTIAKTGGDISAAHQVIATHLSAPLPFAQGGHGLGSGAAGGLLYFATPTSLASSLALAQNQPVLGGGALGPPYSGSRSGTTTILGTVSGTFTPERQVGFDAGGNLTASAFPVGTPTQAGLVWNIVTQTCTQDPSLGKLTVNLLGQIICLEDAGGSLAGVGTVTSIHTTAPLQGGPIVTTGTLSITPAQADGSTVGAAAFVATDFDATVAGVISLDYFAGQKASATLPGFLLPGDWTTFNTKVGPTRAFNTSAPLAGGGDLSVNRTLTIANALADNTTRGAAAFVSTDFETVTPGLVALDYAAGQKASATLPGFLTADDWTTFNAKADATRQILTTLPLGGGGTLASDRTLTCVTCVTAAASLTAGAPVLGAGGQAVALGTRSGTTTEFGTVSGTKTTGKQVAFDASGNLIASATDIAGGSLADPGASGYLVRTALNTTVARQMLGTAGLISITNATGVAGDTIFTVGAQVVTTTQLNTFSGAGRLTGLPAPTADSDVATKAYADSISSGLSVRGSVRVATTVALTATYANGAAGVGATLTNTGTLAALSLDGVALASTERVLVKNQAAPAQNGIYTVTTVGSGAVAWVLTRATDYDATAEIVGGSYTLTGAEGSTQAGTFWLMTTSGIVEVGTTGIVFTQWSQASQTVTLTGPITGTGVTTIPTSVAFLPSATPALGSLVVTAISSPATPLAGTGVVYVHTMSKNLAMKGDDGLVRHGVQTRVPVASQWVTGISADGTVAASQPAAADLSNGLTGTGEVVLRTNSALITPSLGVATATSLNGLTITPSTGTLTLAPGVTVTMSNTLAFTGSNGASVALGAGGTVLYTTRSVATTAPLQGGGDLSTNRTLSIANAAADGTTLGAAAFVANDFNATAGVIALDYTAGQKASATLSGFLLNTDWTTFNTKVGPTRAFNTSAPLAGGGDFSTDRTLSIANALADGSTKGAAAFISTDFLATAGVVSLNYAAGQKATGALSGFLLNTDWTVFNTKQPLITWGPGLTFAGSTARTASTAAGFLTNGGSTNLACAGVNYGKMQVMDTSELQYCDGAATSVLRSGVLTQSGLRWNVIPAICTGDTNNGKLSVNVSSEIVCLPDVGGGTFTAGTPGHVTYYTGTTTIAGSTALKVNGTSLVSLKPEITALVNTNLTLGDHHTVYCTAGASDRTLTLPSAAASTAGYYLIIKADTGVGRCLVARAGSDTINGAVFNATIGTQWEFVELRLVNSASPGNWHATYGVVQPYATNPQTSAYQVTPSDFAGYKTIPVASGTFTVTLVATAAQPPPGQFIRVINYGPGVVTIARVNQNLNGGTAPLLLPAATATAPTSATIISDGVNYVAEMGGAGGGGVTDAPYVTTAAHAGLSAAVVVSQIRRSWVHLPVGAAKLPATNPARIDNSETNTRLLFDAATSQCAWWQFVTPQDYGATPQVRLHYSMTSAAAGSVFFDVSVLAVTPGDAVDINTKAYAAVAHCDDTNVPGTPGFLDQIVCTIAATDGMAAGDFAKLRVCRDITDTAGGDAEIVGMLFEYLKQ